jgi:hypothetical protein
VLAWRPLDLPVPQHDPTTVRHAARDILQRPEFKPARRSWLSTELSRLLSRLVGSGGSGLGPATIIVVVLVGLVVAAAGYLAFRHFVRVPAGPSQPVVVTTNEMLGRSTADWRAQAASYEAAGRWRDALRCRYRALIAELVGRGLVDEVPGRTSGEYRRVVDDVVPRVAPAFDDATAMFEQAWYGEAPTGPGEQTQFDELAGRVLAEVR